MSKQQASKRQCEIKMVGGCDRRCGFDGGYELRRGSDGYALNLDRSRSHPERIGLQAEADADFVVEWLSAPPSAKKKKAAMQPPSSPPPPPQSHVFPPEHKTESFRLAEAQLRMKEKELLENQKALQQMKNKFELFQKAAAAKVSLYAKRKCAFSESSQVFSSFYHKYTGCRIFCATK